MLQIFVLLTNPEQWQEEGVFISILASTLTTGFTCAIIAFDKDVDTKGRTKNKSFYGYIPDDYTKRGSCFILMTFMSASHNISRSVGCALLAITGGNTLLTIFIGGEIIFYLSYKALRRDILYWIPVYGFLGVIVSIIGRILCKIVVDFSGCLHMRHPYEVGGLAFTVSMVWAQAMPFVALSLLKDDEVDMDKSAISFFLMCNFALWLLLNIAFFCTIDLSYLHTFFSTETASQHAVHGFLDSINDEEKFTWAFSCRTSHIEPIHGAVKAWVFKNIEIWRLEEADWFNISQVPDEFIPVSVFWEEGGPSRKRSSSKSSEEVIRSIVSSSREKGRKIHPAAVDRAEPSQANERPLTAARKSRKALENSKTVEQWKKIAEEIYSTRSNNHKSNYIHVERIFEKNEVMFAPVLLLCPRFAIIIAYIMEDRLGWRVRKVDWTKKMKDWDGQDCRRVGCSLATFIRKRKTGGVALSAWR